MPSRTFRQARFMSGIAHGMKPKGGKGPSVSVAKEFVKADSKSGLLKRAMRSIKWVASKVRLGRKK